MSIKPKTILWLAPLMLILSACTTIPVAVPPPKPYLDAALREKCKPLPKLDLTVGEDLRGPVLLNRAQSDAVNEECAARHLATLKAIGVEPIE